MTTIDKHKILSELCFFGSFLRLTNTLKDIEKQITIRKLELLLTDCYNSGIQMHVHPSGILLVNLLYNLFGKHGLLKKQK